MIEIAIIGFGRMGLSHLSILRGLIGSKSHRVTVFDTSLAARVLAKLLVPQARIVKKYSVRKLRRFDYVLFTTPPFNRSHESKVAEQLDGYVFIEKPIIAKLPSNAMSGYVLQHSPLINKLSRRLRAGTVSTIVGQVKTPLDFSGTTGWRSTQFGNITSEFCGHIITLALTPMRTKSHSIDTDSLVVFEKENNMLSVKFTLNKTTTFYIELLANCKGVRKTSYKVEYNCDNGHVVAHNLYQVAIDGVVVDDVASSGTNSPFYLRGFEFSSQMERFFFSQGDVLSNATINEVERLVAKIQEGSEKPSFSGVI